VYNNLPKNLVVEDLMRELRHIISVDDLSDGDIGRLFYAARGFKKNKATKKFEGAVCITAFFEPSTRTRLSFELAAHRLGLGVSSFHLESSSLLKGESRKETLNNLFALEPDVLILRQGQKLDLGEFAINTTVVINGGDGVNEHPSQALLDCFTLLEHFASDNLQGRKILIVGDVHHSRVARSNIKLMKRLLAHVSLLTPLEFGPLFDFLDLPQFHDFDHIKEKFDVVMCLRLQKERLGKGLIISDEELKRRFGLSFARLLSLGEACVMLHPGPVNEGVDMDESLLRHSRSLIAEQVKNGVLVRAALFEHCLS
jgi:aspartate carbamoyltransferase catalytic subunit